MQKPGVKTRLAFAEQGDCRVAGSPRRRSRHKDVEFPRQVGPGRPKFESWVLKVQQEDIGGWPKFYSGLFGCSLENKP